VGLNGRHLKRYREAPPELTEYVDPKVKTLNEHLRKISDIYSRKATSVKTNPRNNKRRLARSPLFFSAEYMTDSDFSALIIAVLFFHCMFAALVFPVRYYFP
jgi:hypothetical protein